MKRHTSENGLEWLTFDLLSEFPHLSHGIFTRRGGESEGEYGSLNFGRESGDNPDAVTRNWKKACQTVQIDSFASLFQVHGKKIIEAKIGLKEEADGLVTDKKKIALFILHADCQAAIFYDPIHHACANVHCGWRGNVQNIYKETVDTMRERYGSKAENLLVGISPSLGPNASEFIHFKNELPEVFYPFQIRPTYFNLWEVSRWQLIEAGILPHHIEIAEMCTYQNATDFFSYRRFKKSGRHATFAFLT